MEPKYLNILADKATQVLETMTGDRVYGYEIKSNERTNQVNCVEVIVPYEHLDQKASGAFILAMCDEKMACLIASAIGRLLDLPPIDKFGEPVVDILNEFMNTVVGQTVTAWDHQGLSASFQPPHNGVDHEKSDVPDEISSSYVINLRLKVGHLAFWVIFREKKDVPLSGKKILVVDDSSMIRRLVAKNLTKMGALVEVAEDGYKAVEAYRSFRPDLTIMDLIMPELGGLEAMRKIREFDGAARFVVLTSSSRREEVVTAKILEVERYLLKPVKIPELTKTARELLT